MLCRGERDKIFSTSWVATRFNNPKQKHLQVEQEKLIQANQLDQMELVVVDMDHPEEQKGLQEWAVAAAPARQKSNKWKIK